MKVQVTYELSEDERIVIGIAETARVQPATREQCRDFFQRHKDSVLKPGLVKLTGFYERILEDLDTVEKIGKAVKE